jgi:DNA helicase-2/ATP-dependent DNA helicase PcrA
VRSTLNIDHRSQRFPAKRSLAKLFTFHKNKQLDMRVLLQEYYPQFLIHEKDVIRLFKTYESYKAKHHIMDFDDLLFNTEKLFVEHPAILERVSSTCQYVLVDEYQDTNKIQASLCEYLSSFHQNLTVVGDDAQSIYAFRGSDYENILRFPEEHANTELIKLEENYRSSPEILEVANAVLEQSSILFKKKLFTNRESSDLPALIKAIDDKEEAEFISQLVLHLREHQITLGEVAVLFRNARDSFTLELALQSKNIPFKKFGGQKFTEAAHIKDVLAHIRILSNPNDTVAWQRVLMLIEGVGPKTAEDLFLWIQEVQSKQGGASTTNSTHWFSDSEWMNKNYYNGLNRLGSCLINASKCTPWHDSIPLIVDYYLPICKDLYDDASKREEDLASLLQIAKTYIDIQSFLTDLVLEPITDTVTDTLASREEEAPLTLSTIHSAKGLEWKHVLIMQCLDGSIPSTFSIDNEESLDEELRLLYVATTRAKEMLYFTYPRTSFRQREGDYLTKASRFLDPITAKLEPWELIHDTHDPNLNEGKKPPLLE